MAVRQRLALNRGKNRALAREIGLVPLTTLVQGPQSNDMAEAFVKTIARDYARVIPRPDATTAPARQLVRALQYGRSTQSARLPLAARIQDTDGVRRDRERSRRCRPHESPTSADAIGSSPPAACSAESRSVWLDRVQPWTTLRTQALSAYYGATTVTICNKE